MAQAIDLQQPPERLNRTELTLRQIGQAWSRQLGGEAYARTLVEFLRQQQNPHTLRSYSYAVLQLFGWYDQAHGRLVTPEQIRRSDASEYDTWLRTSELGLRSWYLQNDDSREVDLAIFNVVKERGEAAFADVRSRMRASRWGPQFERRQDLLAARLACLVRHKTLERTPSIAAIRRGDVDVGLERATAARVGLDVPVPPEVFTYRVPERTGSSAERAPTVAARLSALSSLWRFWMGGGDNLTARPLLTVNVWSDLLKKASRQAPAQSLAYRQRTTTTMSLFERLLATTYARTHEARALEIAASAMGQGALPPGGASNATYNDLRDRALLLLLGQVGVRAGEVGQIRRSDMRRTADGVLLTVHGKGDKIRQVRLPPMVVSALDELTVKLRHMARHEQRQGRAPKAQLLLEPAAPLLPAVRRWGANAGVRATRGIGRSAIAMMLRRRAVATGLRPSDEEFARVHPHGIRHLFAKAALGAGTPVNVLQGMLGHSRGSQTMQYVEEHDPSELVSRAHAPPVAAMPEPASEADDDVDVAEEIAGLALPEITHVVAADQPPPPKPAAAPTLTAERAPRPRRPRQPDKTEPEREPREPARPLLGVGEEPEHVDDEDTQIGEQAYALDQLERIYTANWGERGNRSKLEPTAIPLTDELEQLGIDQQLAALLGAGEVVERIGVGQNRLTHTYVGADSGLLWWQGSTGKLSRAMPVLSPEQAGSCSVTEQNDVCGQLGDLWLQWASGEGRGPTGAAALAAWFAEALETAAQVESEVVSRGGQWVAPDAPWDETADEVGERKTFREHEPEALVGWFEDHAWQHRRYPTRGRKVVDEPLAVPDYYGAVDPLAELGRDERSRALGWLAALTGQALPTGHARYEVARLIRAMCAYDEQRAYIGEHKARARAGGDADQATLRLLERAADQQAAEVDRIAVMANPSAGFSMAQAVDERVKGRTTGSRERLRDFYLRVVARIFGPEVAAEPVVRVLAMCGHAPLAQDPFKDLLRIDWPSQTIRTSRDFARDFAAETGSHPDCVGRRIARDLWQMQLEHMSGKRQRMLERPDELVERVQTMAAYRIPCPKSLEHELRTLLPFDQQSGPVPIYEAWQAAQRAEELATTTHSRAEIEEELSAFAEDYGSAAVADWIGGEGVMFDNPGGPLRVTRAAASRLPTPLHLLAALLA